MTRRKWDAEDIQMLRSLYDAGLTYKQIGVEMNISHQTVKNALVRYGFRKQQKRPEPTYKTYNPNPVTYTTRMIICCSAFRGESIEQIAKDIDRPQYIVCHILKQCLDNGFYHRINAEQGQYVPKKRYREIYQAIIKAYERVAPFI